MLYLSLGPLMAMNFSLCANENKGNLMQFLPNSLQNVCVAVVYSIIYTVYNLGF